MKRILYFILFAGLVILLTFFLKPKDHNLKINQHIFKIHIARSDRDLANGLSNLSSLDQDRGMLFLFNKPGHYTMWMKSTLIPLDMIFIDENNKVISIHKNAQPHDLAPISASFAFKSVLEINGGLCDKLGIKPGDLAVLD